MFDMSNFFISPAATGGVSSTPLEQSPPDMPLQFDMTTAFLYYAVLGVIDPRNLLDAKGIAKVLGISYVGGLSIAAIVGALGMGTVITIVDPKHKYAGGVDDTSFGKTLFGSRKMSKSSIMASQSQSITGMPVLTYEKPTYTYDAYY